MTVVRTLAALALPVLLAVAGCSSGQPSAADVAAVHSSGLATPASSPTAAPKAQPAKSPRGTIIKKIGEPAGICTDESCGTVSTTFTVDKIEPGVKCTEPYAPKPERGNFIAVTVTVKTTDKLTVQDGQMLGLGPYDFFVVGPDGITESAGAGGYGCIKEGLLFPTGPWSPASQYTGVVMLDSKHKSGILTLRFQAATAGGWEWNF
jgi:hypothetical protein